MRVSRQIGWSDKSNVLYNILQELEAISCKIACSSAFSGTIYWGEDSGTACGGSIPITVIGDGTTFCNSNNFEGPDIASIGTGTVFFSYGGQIKTVNVTSGSPIATFNGGCDPCPTTPCNTYVLLSSTLFTSYTGTDCSGNSISGDVNNGIVLCAQSITYDGPLYNLDSTCNPECTLYSIEPSDDINSYQYTDCDGNVITGSFSTLEAIYVCLKPGTTSGENVIFTEIGPCKCVEYQINGGFTTGGTYSYIGCDFSENRNIPIDPEETITVCALFIPTISDPVNMGVSVIGICNP
jgi:hypothetical protein